MALAWLRRAYADYPRRAAVSELLFIFGMLLAHRWAVTFWYWGVYRLNLRIPEPLSDFFYWIWLERDIIRAILIGIVVVFILASNIVVRRYSFADVGIRFDTVWKSARECLPVAGLILAASAAVALTFPQSFSFQKYFAYNNFFGDIAFGLISGTFQQFMLQGVFLIRALQIFENKPAAVFTSAAMFSLLHTPNTTLMALTFVFGGVCSLLFIRNRNIFVLGVLHSVVQQTLRVFVSSMVVSGVTYYNIGYYDYTLRVGPRRGDPAFLAELQYRDGSRKISPSGSLLLPIRIINKSNVNWDSDNAVSPVYLSYHLLDSQGNVVSYENSLGRFDTPLEPGEEATIDLVVDIPPGEGDYYAEVDLFTREPSGARTTIWFKYKGSKTLLVPLSNR